MKTLISLAVLAIFAMAGAGLTGKTALAANGVQNHVTGTQDCRGKGIFGIKVPTLSTSRSYCADTDAMASMSYPPVFAVSCASGEWCCKHDIGGTGACTKCCSK